MRLSTKNMSKQYGAKILLGGFLFFCPLLTSAQYEEDSVYDEDSVMVSEETTTDTTAEGEYQEKKDKEKKIWFLKKQAYNGDSLALQRNIPDSIVKKMQEDDNFWYANAIPEKKKTQPAADADPYVPIGQRNWFQTLIWLIIIGGFAAFLMIYLSGSNIGLFRRKNKISNTGEEEVATDDIFAINYQKEIDKAAAVGNYRLAVRLMFLRLLKNMSEKNIIRYQQDKTNLDYLLQLHSTKHYTDFFRITRNYEYSWYGKFEVSEKSYRIISNDFDHFENGLRQV